MSTLESLTVCRLCNQPVNFGPPIIGERPEQKSQRYMTALSAHLNGAHFHKAAQLRTISQTFADTFRQIMTVQCFITAEPALLAAYDAARAPIHDLTRRNRLSDDDLQKMVEEFATATAGPFAKTVTAAAMPLARKLRDLLSEQGEYEHPVVKAAREGAGKPVTA